MQHKLLASLLASTSLLAFAACGDDGGSVTPEYDADFAAADEAHVARAITAGLGFDATIAQLTVMGYASFPADTEVACPTFERDGDTTTVTGGCTMDDGSKIEGRIVFSNVPGAFTSDGYDATKPTTMEFDGFSVEDDEGSFAYDGSLRIEPSGARTVDLTVALDGESAHAKLALDCDAQQCEVTGESWVDVDGLGGAKVEGSWNLAANAPAGALTLRGAQVLEADIANAADDCIPYSIDGEAQPALCAAE